ncbi:MAG: DUF1573 domain-containing protein, partial [Bacteroidales bacterium]|nr:DUF1573 domain-containing protein [Bacteroidales bacterium]
SFQTKIHDFGQVSEDDKTASFDFKFTNKGKGPLVIHKAIASCGCTTPVYPKEPIAAGASASIKVTYNTVGRPGAFHKTITIYCNDIDSPNVVLIIKGDVKAGSESTDISYPKDMQGLRLNRAHLSMLNAKIGSIRTETISMINTNKVPVKISFNMLPKHIEAIASKTVLKTNETGTLTIKYNPSLANDYGNREDFFFVVTNPNDRENPNNRIYINANITEDFSNLSAAERANAPIAKFSEDRINYGKMASKTNKIASISLRNAGKSPLYIRKIVPEYDEITVTPEKKKLKQDRLLKSTLVSTPALLTEA